MVNWRLAPDNTSDFPCTFCDADSRQDCLTAAGTPTGKFHEERIAAAEAAARQEAEVLHA